MDKGEIKAVLQGANPLIKGKLVTALAEGNWWQKRKTESAIPSEFPMFPCAPGVLLQGSQNRAGIEGVGSCLLADRSMKAHFSPPFWTGSARLKPRLAH